jgi:sugar O-acyltransferase (sialic acid O-acetyltransferase NeuD family)
LNKIIIFGVGDIAEEVNNYLTLDSDFEVVAFTQDKKFIKKSSFMNKPIIPFEKIQNKFSPKNFKMFIAIGYTDFNQLRFRKYKEAKKKGYELISYISSKASVIGKQRIGDNSLILENTSVQTTAKIGSNVFLWCNNLIGHHAVIKDNVYIAGNCVVAGSSLIDKFCFLGINSSVTHGIKIGTNCFVGAHTLVNESLKKNTFCYSPPGKIIKISSLDLINKIIK